MKKYVFLTVILASMLVHAETILDKAKAAEKFNTLIAALKAADLTVALKSSGPFTVLAPTDSAFAKLPDGTVETLLKPENKDKLTEILKYHVIKGKFTARQVASLEAATMLNGEDIAISIKEGRLTANNSNIVATDIDASNGIIHIIDQVLLPPEISPERKVLSYIEDSIERGVSLFNHNLHKACGDVYETAIKGLLSFSTTMTTDQKAILKTALRQTIKENDTARAWTLRKALDQIYKINEMSMRELSMLKEDNDIIIEADLPKGFPRPGPVNKIAVKSFPIYRAAKVDGPGQNFSFMRLFGHIKQNNISMTAPVEMKLDGQSGQRQDMAFLYGNTGIGKVGTTNQGIEVLDIPAQEYVSLGMRGTENQSVIKTAISKLQNWLKDNPDYKSTGEPRLLGYNSPMVPAQKRYWEVQIPISKN